MIGSFSRRFLALGVATTLLGACGGVDAVGDAVEQAEETVQLVEFCTAGAELLSALNNQDMSAAMGAAETMVAEAPKDVAREAETVLAGVQAARDGDTEAVKSEEFQAAASEVETYARENCDPAG